MATDLMAQQAQAELELEEYTQQVRDTEDAYEPTFKIMWTARGGGFSDLGSMPNMPLDDGSMIVAAISAVFAPRITNITKIEVFRRRPGDPPGVFPPPVYTGYTNHKADTVGLDSAGEELVILCGTHVTGVPLDENGARDYFIEKDEVPGFFAP